MEAIAVLGGSVATRTCRPITLDFEINGHWPCETTLLAQQAGTPETTGPA
jgi:hypothetical protein